VREGHGDLHLGNLIVWDGRLTAFDCIEFDPALRWIDVVDDMGFTVMDLWAHGRRDLAFGFLNDYMDASGEHRGLGVLRFHLVARALVRAWVAALRPSVAGPDYLALAQRLAAPGDARLLITHGLPGVGKSHVSSLLLARAGAVRLRSDVERRRLTDPDERYGPQATERTFAYLAGMARIALRAGFPTIVDAAFLQRAERDRLRDLAAAAGVPFAILDCQAPMPTLRERVAARSARGDDPSEADLAVLDKLAALQQPLDADERAAAIGLDTSAPLGAAQVDGLVDRWLDSHRLRGQ
jgi:predicted kinase